MGVQKKAQDFFCYSCTRQKLFSVLAIGITIAVILSLLLAVQRDQYHSVSRGALNLFVPPQAEPGNEGYNWRTQGHIGDVILKPNDQRTDRTPMHIKYHSKKPVKGLGSSALESSEAGKETQLVESNNYGSNNGSPWISDDMNNNYDKEKKVNENKQENGDVHSMIRGRTRLDSTISKTLDAGVSDKHALYGGGVAGINRTHIAKMETDPNREIDIDSGKNKSIGVTSSRTKYDMHIDRKKKKDSTENAKTEKIDKKRKEEENVVLSNNMGGNPSEKKYKFISKPKIENIFKDVREEESKREGLCVGIETFTKANDTNALWRGKNMRQHMDCLPYAKDIDKRVWYRTIADSLLRRTENPDKRCCPLSILGLRNSVSNSEFRVMERVRDNKFYQRSSIVLDGYMGNNLLYIPDTVARKAPRKLMIVSHPDDEVIFGGSALLDLNGKPKKDWLIIYATMDPNRINMSHTLADRWGWNGILNFAQADTNSYDQLLHVDFVEDLCEVLCAHKWDTVVTHGLSGEYGHVIHQKLHRIVSSLLHDLSHDMPEGYSKPDFRQFLMNKHRPRKTDRTKEQTKVLRNIYHRPSKWFAEMCTTSEVSGPKTPAGYSIQNLLCK
eukprot:CFRG8287T1